MLPPLAVLMLGNQSSLCSRGQELLSLISLLPVSGFEQCMSIPDDSTATFTKYIARLNESLAQLATVKPMSPGGSHHKFEGRMVSIYG